MRDYQREFIQFAHHSGALRFGEFRLKSGRVSPYFFNAGDFNSGASLARLGAYYAAAISARDDLQFDLLFGPAYKGIPLVAAVSVALAERHQQDYPWCFNRKEAKDHGEGGMIVGAPLNAGAHALIIDDVISAGTAVRETMQLLAAHKAKPAGVVIALDRQEKGRDQRSAIQEVEQDYRVAVISVVTLAHLIDYASEQPDLRAKLDPLRAYREQYGINT